MTSNQIDNLKKLANADSTIFALFESDALEQIADIKTHALQGNLFELSKTIHALKGSAGLFLADSCVKTCVEFERAIKENSLDKFEYYISSLSLEIENYCQNLRTFNLVH